MTSCSGTSRLGSDDHPENHVISQGPSSPVGTVRAVTPPQQTILSPHDPGSQLREYRGRTIARVATSTESRRYTSSPDPRTFEGEQEPEASEGSPTPRLRSVSLASTVVNVGRQEDEQEDYLMAVNIAALSSMDLGMSGGGRSATSMSNAMAAGQLNGVGPGGGAGPGGAGPNFMTSLPAGHQQDLNYLFDKIQELSKLLASNREKVRELTKKAEEAGRRALANANANATANANANGAHPEPDGEGSVQTDGARILELERELKKRDYLIEVYKHEQRENTSLIGLYEQTVGTMTEQIRNYCLGIEQRFLDQQKHYNNLLQLEKDDHLKSRLERDEYFAQTLKLSGQIRHANRLRTDEWCDEFRVIAALQTQVRCLRRVVGWDAEKPEEEAGWEYLRECPLNDTGTGDGV